MAKGQKKQANKQGVQHTNVRKMASGIKSQIELSFFQYYQEATHALCFIFTRRSQGPLTIITPHTMLKFYWFVFGSLES
jgi:hypothetical protein